MVGSIDKGDGDQRRSPRAFWPATAPPSVCGHGEQEHDLKKVPYHPSTPCLGRLASSIILTVQIKQLR